jgi:Origin of replication binding protein
MPDSDEDFSEIRGSSDQIPAPGLQLDDGAPRPTELKRAGALLDNPRATKKRHQLPLVERVIQIELHPDLPVGTPVWIDSAEANLLDSYGTTFLQHVTVRLSDDTERIVPPEALTRVVRRQYQNPKLDIADPVLSEHVFFKEPKVGDLWFATNRGNLYHQFTIGRFVGDDEDDATYLRRVHDFLQRAVLDVAAGDRRLFARVPKDKPRFHYCDIDISDNRLASEMTVANSNRLARLLFQEVDLPALRDELEAREFPGAQEWTPRDYLYEHATKEGQKLSLHGTYGTKRVCPEGEDGSPLFATAEMHLAFVRKRIYFHWQTFVSRRETDVDAAFFFRLMGVPGDGDRYDEAVYRNNQNWRLHGNTKAGKNNWLQPTDVVSPGLLSEIDLLMASLVHPLPSVEQAFLASEWAAQTPQVRRAPVTEPVSNTALVELVDEEAQRIKRWLVRMDEDGIGVGAAAFTVAPGPGRIRLVRQRPSYCHICGRQHDNDNAWIDVSQEGKVIVGCYRNSRVQEVPLAYLEPPAQEIEIDEVFVRTEDSGVTFDGNRVFVDARQVYRTALGGDCNVVDDLEDINICKQQGLFAVRAPMGFGKTEKLISEFKRRVDKKMIVWLTPRRSLARNAAERLGEMFALYLDTPGKIDLAKYPCLVLQVESMCRLDVGSNSDGRLIVVLDEVQALCAQLTGDTMKNGGSVTMFEWLLRTADLVVVMDAHLETWHLDVIAGFMKPQMPRTVYAIPQTPEKQRFSVPKIWVVQNVHRPTIENYVLTQLRQGKRVVVATNFGPKYVTSLSRAGPCSVHCPKNRFSASTRKRRTRRS